MIFDLNKIMKKPISIIILGLLGTIFLTTPALAATTISLSPSNIAITQGQSFNIIIGVNPQGIKNYTAKIQIQYPADLLEAKSFTFGGGWMALSQPEYDLVDNINGVFVKTAGFPGGVSEPVVFGTVSFLAKKTGEGIIKVEDTSLTLDATNKNILSGPLAQTSVTIAVPVLPPEEEVIPPEEEVLPPEEEVLPPEEEVSVPPRPLFDILTEPLAKQLQGKPLIPILVAIGILILIIAGYVLYKRRKKVV